MLVGKSGECLRLEHQLDRLSTAPSVVELRPTSPAVAIVAITRFGIVWFGLKLRLDAFGREASNG